MVTSEALDSAHFDDAAPLVRIAHVDSEHDFAGGEVQVLLLLDGLRRRGFSVILVCPPDSESARRARDRGIDVIEVAMRTDADLPATVRLARLWRELHIELVHLHTGRANVVAGAAAWWAGVPAVTTRRMERPVRDSWKSRAVYGAFTAATVAISPAVATCLAGGGVDPQRIHVIPEAVDPTRVESTRGRAAVRAELGAAPDDVVVLCVAALVHRKGLDVLVDAVTHLQAQGAAPVVWIAGDGADRGKLEAACAASRAAGRIRFLGRRDDVGDLLAGCDVFVLPSRREGLGVAALEAMAAGRPVVCSAVGGLADSVVHGRTGMLVPPGDVAALAAVLARLVNDAGLRASLGREGPRRIAERFAADAMIDAHVRLYGELLAR